MNERVVEDYVTYHVKSNDHHAPEEEVGTVNDVYYLSSSCSKESNSRS